MCKFVHRYDDTVILRFRMCTGCTYSGLINTYMHFTMFNKKNVIILLIKKYKILHGCVHKVSQQMRVSECVFSVTEDVWCGSVCWACQSAGRQPVPANVVMTHRVVLPVPSQRNA